MCQESWFLTNVLLYVELQYLYCNTCATFKTDTAAHCEIYCRWGFKNGGSAFSCLQCPPLATEKQTGLLTSPSRHICLHESTLTSSAKPAEGSSVRKRIHFFSSGNAFVFADVGTITNICSASCPLAPKEGEPLRKKMDASLKRLIVCHLASEISVDVKEDTDAALGCLSVSSSRFNIATNRN